MNMQPWKHIKEPEEIKLGWRKVTRKVFERPDGPSAEYVTYGGLNVRHAGVIAVTVEGKAVVAEQFRPGPELIMQELPGGTVDRGEDPQVAAMRELREETGYASENVEFLGIARKDAYMNDTWYYYLARDCRELQKQTPEDGEIVNVKLVTIGELIHNAMEGKMTDHPAVLLAYEKLQEIKQEGK
jgi:ADP-ribose pyrophosphatase